MPPHRVPADLIKARFPTSSHAFWTANGFLYGWGTTVGNSVEGWAPGAQFVETDQSDGQERWSNVGTKTTAVWRSGLFVTGGTSSHTGTDGTAIHIGSFGTPLALNTSGQKGIAAYFSSTATSGGITGMRLRTRGNAASGTQTVLSLLCQADVLAGKTAGDCIAGDFQAIAKLGATMASGGWFVGAQFKVEDEEATGTSGTNITYGGHVAVLRLMSQISANPSNEHCMIFTDAQEATEGSAQALDSLIAIQNAGKNPDTLSIFHWLGNAGLKSTGNYALVLGDSAANESAWTGSNEKGYLSININGTYYQIPFFASS